MLNIKRKQTPHGPRSQLTYWQNGHRYRPTLGYNLTRDEERRAALAFIAELQDLATRPPDAATLTFAAFIPTYLQRMLSAIVKTEVGCPQITDLRCPLFTDEIVQFFISDCSIRRDLRWLGG